MTLEEIKRILPTLPESPGCYKYFDTSGRVVYVGKAKNLRRRVSSYFRPDLVDPKTRHLVESIDRLEYIVVETEYDALLLENNLIKEHQPRYNILLKDGKTYPEIIIRSEPFPRISVLRRAPRDGSMRFGPYPSAQMAHATVAMIKDLYPIRTCSLDLSPERIRQGRYRVCLQYHIKKCKAPCVSRQSREDYDANIREIVGLLKGELGDVVELYREEMMRISEELRFEEAQIYKERLLYLEQYKARHTVAPQHIHNVDVFCYERDEDLFFVNYLHISQGMVIRADTVEYRPQLEEHDEELFVSAITELRERYRSAARELILPHPLEWSIAGVTTQTVPQRGDKKKLLELSERNVRQYKVDRYKQAERLNPDQRMMQVLGDLQRLLSMERLPMYIECFDNSHVQGQAPVSACVVFRKAKPSKKDYRKYHLRSSEAGDDYGAMKEVVHRRYKRLTEEQASLPDLILVDGGKGQLSVVQEVMAELGLQVPVAGLVKDERHHTRELLHGSPIGSIPVRHDGPTFKLLEHIQSEVHRFVITFHRDTRSKGQVASRLDYIKGIGGKTKDALLAAFRSVRRLQEAEEQSIAEVVGASKARLIYQALHGEDE